MKDTLPVATTSPSDVDVSKTSGTHGHGVFHALEGHLNPVDTSRRDWFIFLMLCLAVATITYLPAFDSGFVSDDFSLISGVDRGGPFGVWTRSGSDFFRPVVAASLYMNYAFSGLDAVAYHVTNVAMHVLNAVLVAMLAWQLLAVESRVRDARLISFGAGLLFLLFCSHTEAVSWIAGRTDVIATLFSLCALIAVVRYAQRRSIVWGTASIVFGVLALGSKEAAIVLPGIALAVTALVVRDSDRPVRRRVLWQVALTGVVIGASYVVIRTLLIGKLIGGYGELHAHFSPVDAFLNLVLNFPGRVLFIPFGKATFAGVSVTRSGVLFAGFAAVVIGVWLFRRVVPLRHLIIAVALCYGLSVLPVLNLYVSAIDTQGERLLYLPSVFVALGVVLVLATVVGRRTLIVALVGYTVVQGVWLNSANRRWLEAGSVVTRILDDYRAMASHGPTTIINLPDHVGGAYVFRSGFDPACRLHGLPTHADGLNVLVRNGIEHASDSSAVELGPESLRLIVQSPTSFVAPLPPFGDSSILLESRSRNELEVFLGQAQRVGTQFAYFSRGGLVRLNQNDIRRN